MLEININEYAAIVFHIVENCNDWGKLYLIAKGPKSLNKVTEDSKNTMIYRWKNKPEVKKAIPIIKNQIEAKKNEFKQMILAGEETETTNRATKSDITEKTNFLNLDEFLQYANQQANKITDEKEKRAWVEMIGKYMNFKESEEGETEQIKAYLPIQCYSCELHKRCKACKYDHCPVEV